MNTPLDDEERGRRADLLRTVLAGAAATVAVWGLATFAAGPQLRHRAVVALPLAAVIAASATLERRGRVRAASQLFVFGFWSLLALSRWMLGAVRETSFGWHLLIVLVAALLLGRTPALVLAALSLGYSLLARQGERVGLVPPAPDSLAAAAIAHGAILILSVTLVHVATGEVAAALSRARRELSERRQAAGLLRALLDATTETAFLLDRRGVLLAANEPLARAAGLGAAELVGRSAYDLLPADLARSRREKVDEVFAAGLPVRFEDRGADGRWYDNSLFPVFDEAGAVAQVAVFARDTTEMRNAQAELVRLANRLATLHEVDGAILEARSPQAVAAAAVGGLQKFLPALQARVLALEGTSGAARTVAVVPADWEPRGPDGLGDLQGLRRGAPALVADADDEGSPLARWARANGGRSALALPLGRGEQLLGVLQVLAPPPRAFDPGFVEGAREVARHLAVATDHARLHEEVQRRAAALEQAYAKLARLDRAKSDFIMVAAHELRTPLTLVLGYSELLEADAAEGASVSALAADIRQGAKRLHEIVLDMLDLTTLDRTPQVRRREAVALEVVAREVARAFAPSLAQRKLDLTLEVGALPMVPGDAKALARALEHLVMNAIKFTPDGGAITVRGRAREGEVELVVEDTGIGVDAADQDLIFDAFFQGGPALHHSSSRTRFKGGGPGLGLALARKVAEAHGGRVWVESAGRDEARCPGSRFGLVLPLA